MSQRIVDVHAVFIVLLDIRHELLLIQEFFDEFCSSTTTQQLLIFLDGCVFKSPTSSFKRYE